MAITQNTYTGDGSTVLFSFTFEYLQEADIKVTLSGTPTPTTEYTLDTDTSSILFNTPPANGVAIRIYRDTDIDTLSAEFFPGSAIRAEDLNNNYTQSNYAVQEAKREADAAVTTSNSALFIVSNAISYDPVVNVASIPAAPSDGDRIEVFDSTGIESYTPLSGVPGGFIGASTLTVRLIYSVTTWVWQDYQSTDPDGRYLKVNGDSTMTGNLVMGTNSITGLGDPTSAQDAATKKYVDERVITSADIADNTIVNADINSAADIAVSKLADGAARQLLQTDAAGTGVEWTDNVDVPGTLDVTGAVTFDSTADISGDVTITDKIIHSGDTDTAIRFPAADTVSVEVAGGEAVRVDSSGKLYVNTTDTVTQDALLNLKNSVDNDWLIDCYKTNKGKVVKFLANSPSVQVGSITVSTGNTAFNTTSDYRLKENVVPLTGAVDRVNQLQVHRFNFIVDPDTTFDGFIAHEAQAIVPECVTGTKDEVDDEGNPVYQGIDQSKLVPLLTAALQEAIAKIETLEAKVAALEVQ